MLYIVGTSIGNIQDTSLRAVEALVNADLILSEDTRTFGEYYKRIQELYHVQIARKQKTLSLHDQNEFTMIPEVLAALDNNLNVALVSEAGMPMVSDPGAQLMQHVMKRGYEYTVVPGPTALTTALAHVGNDAVVLFLGFLPKKDSQLNKIFQQLEATPIRPLTVVTYESPHRIQSTLTLLHTHFPTAHATICRELTKKFEQVVRGTPSELAAQTFKGEITLVVQLQ